jgi:16S rRNA processing protein RimM
MLTSKDYLPLGVFTRTHGVQGELVLRLKDAEAEDLPEMEWIFVEIDGLSVPFFVKEASYFQREKIILALETITSEVQARTLIGCKAMLKTEKRKSTKKNIDKSRHIVGYKVIDKTLGPIGEVAEWIDVEGNPLYKIISGNKEILIPAHQDIILDISDRERVIRIDAPEGLLDL